LEIDLLLKKRDIPFELSDYEKSFYSLSYDVKIQSLKQYETNEKNLNNDLNNNEDEDIAFVEEIDEMELEGGLQLKRS